MPSDVALFKFIDYPTLGECVVSWCNSEPFDRPNSLFDALRDYPFLTNGSGEILIPAQENLSIIYITPSLNELIIRLPPADALRSVKKLLKEEHRYPVEHLPRYFRAYLNNGKRYDLDFLYARLADFAITQCE